MNLRNCIDELLVRGTDDWVCTGEVLAVAQEIGGAEGAAEMQALGLDLMREVVRQGLMEIGVPPESDTGQRPLPLKLWPGTSEEWLKRIEREWPKLRGSAEYGIYCWFQNTARGEEIARQLLAERERESRHGP